MTPKKRGTKRSWTTEEIDILKDLIRSQMPIDEIGGKLGRTPRAIYDKAFKENISFRSYRKMTWTAEETDHLKILIREKTPVRIISEKLGRSTYAVYNKIFRDKLSVKAAD